MNLTVTVGSSSILTNDRLDAHFFTSPGVAAGERVKLLRSAGVEVAEIGDLARAWDPPRFARAYAAPAEPGIPYLRPYDVFDYFPVATDRLSIGRNTGTEKLVPSPGTILQTCSGRNLGPCTYADDRISAFALSHDMVRIESEDVEMRMYLLAFLKTPTGQALLRRGKSGSVIDHITARDVASVPVPVVPQSFRAPIIELARRSTSATTEARARMSSIFSSQEERLPPPVVSGRPQDGWTQVASTIQDRLDAAYYDRLVLAARKQVQSSNGVRCGDIAQAILPVRYKRYYVSGKHGRPILSGRQILQHSPVNLRKVSNRSFRDPRQYELQAGMTLFGAVGRSEGRQGAAALVASDRDGWLASNDVMRLTPRDGVRPGSLWLAIAARQTRVQINALSFGSVIDHMNPWDVENIHVPVIEDGPAKEAEAAWELFAQAAADMDEAVTMLESHLANHTSWT